MEIQMHITNKNLKTVQENPAKLNSQIYLENVS